MDQNLTAKQHIFARYNFFNLLDLPLDPFGTGLCADKCAETYQTNAAAIDYSYTIKPNVILSINRQRHPFSLFTLADELELRFEHTLRLACGLQCGNSLRRSFAVHALLHAGGPERYLFARSELHHRP